MNITNNNKEISESLNKTIMNTEIKFNNIN